MKSKYCKQCKQWKATVQSSSLFKFVTSLSMSPVDCDEWSSENGIRVHFRALRTPWGAACCITSAMAWICLGPNAPSPLDDSGCLPSIVTHGTGLRDSDMSHNLSGLSDQACGGHCQSVFAQGWDWVRVLCLSVP